MSAITAIEARRRPVPLIEQVNNDNDHAPSRSCTRMATRCLCPRRTGTRCGTAYLSQGANGRKLRQAIAELDSSEGAPHDLIDAEQRDFLDSRRGHSQLASQLVDRFARPGAAP